MDALSKNTMRKSLDPIPCRAQIWVYSASLGKYCIFGTDQQLLYYIWNMHSWLNNDNMDVVQDERPRDNVQEPGPACCLGFKI